MVPEKSAQILRPLFALSAFFTSEYPKKQIHNKKKQPPPTTHDDDGSSNKTKQKTMAIFSKFKSRDAASTAGDVGSGRQINVFNSFAVAVGTLGVLYTSYQVLDVFLKARKLHRQKHSVCSAPIVVASSSDDLKTTLKNVLTGTIVQCL